MTTSLLVSAGARLAEPLAITSLRVQATSFPVQLVTWQPSHASPIKGHQIYGQARSIRSILDSHCPSLTDPLLAHMTPTPFLNSGNLQSQYCILNALKRDRHSNIVYDRELCAMSNGGTISLDWYPARRPLGYLDSTPIVVVMSGIAGSSYEYHIRCLAMSLANQSMGRECRVVVMNHRGTSKTPLTTGKLYDARDTGDFCDIIQGLKNSYPQAPLVGVGFSMGANLLTRYLGEQGSKSPLAAGIAICCPFDMHALAVAVHRKSLFNDQVFHPTLTSAFKRMAKRNYDVLKASSIGYDMDAIMNVKCLSEFDSLTHAKMYKDCWDYYRDSSSVAHVGFIRTPYLAINTVDDPTSVASSIPLGHFRENPYTALALLEHGGHLGLFTGINPEIWYLSPVAEFINGVLASRQALIL
ncbi:hypothetical protein H4S04_002854 [Coemansia sp. S16]|nr:hypothetical protein H4S04_002854 [Coemansia sp. S16]KAJ2069383.1 hypothetical protein GGI08_000378 [Coemansia sp. S2]KAJ2353817.1 hypothetical protein GGH92_000419 [Coemansia sp. RSA 2673]